MSGFPDELVSDGVLRQAIYIREITQIDLLTKRARMLKENPVEALRTVSFERPCMTERALMALEAYGRFGLTVRELYEKRRIWLLFPDDGLRWETSVKAVSMLLRRLNHRLADREKERREWRYRINDGGRSRLAYHRRVREITRNEKSGFKELSPVLEKNRRTISEMIARNKTGLPSLESSSNLRIQVSYRTYSDLWKRILEMAEAVHTAQHALATGNPRLREAALSQCTNSLTSLRKTQELLFADLCTDKGLLPPVKRG